MVPPLPQIPCEKNIAPKLPMASAFSSVVTNRARHNNHQRRLYLLLLSRAANLYVHSSLFIDHGSHRADMCRATEAYSFAAGTADIPIARCIPLWRCPVVYFPRTDCESSAPLYSRAICERLGINEIDTTSSYHPSANGGVEYVNHTMAHMFKVVVNEEQTDWHVQFPHAEIGYSNSANAATGLRRPRLSAHGWAAFHISPSRSSSIL